MSNRTILIVAVLMVVAPAPPALAQSFNIDIGDGAGTPSAGYAGAGLPGAWNTVTGCSSRTLIALDGAPTDVVLDPWGCVDAEDTWDHPETVGDDERLLDDYDLYTDYSAAWTISGLLPGEYSVIAYGWTPYDPDGFARVEVEGADPPCDYTGGPWPGQLEEGITHNVCEVTVTDGLLRFTPCGTYVSSGAFNGLQLILVEPHIPTVSTWGLAVAVLLLLAAGTIVLRRRSVVV